MPPVPAILFMSPSASAVVALPMIFGPATEKTVETAANIITAMIAAQYLPRYFMSFFVEPLKSLAFSVTIPGPCPIGPLGLLGGILNCSLLFSFILHALLFVIIKSKFLG